MTRTVILHYHLFKNAGTSVDEILKRNFHDKWLTAEFPQNDGDNSALIADWIAQNPQAIAFSTHTGLGPVPELPDTRIISIMMFRDPIARIKSAYRFERQQDADTWGAELAKAHDLEGYVRARLDRQGDRQCRNFQTQRAASLAPGPGSERERALAGLRLLSVVGLVEDFNAAMQALADQVTPVFPTFTWDAVQANTTKSGAAGETDAALNALLHEANLDDLALVGHARHLTEPA